MSRVTRLLRPRAVAIVCAVFGAPLALTAIVLGNPLVALVAAACAGGFIYFMDRARNQDPPPR